MFNTLNPWKVRTWTTLSIVIWTLGILAGDWILMGLGIIMMGVVCAAIEADR